MTQLQLAPEQLMSNRTVSMGSLDFKQFNYTARMAGDYSLNVSLKYPPSSGGCTGGTCGSPGPTIICYPNCPPAPPLNVVAFYSINGAANTTAQAASSWSKMSADLDLGDLATGETLKGQVQLYCGNVPSTVAWDAYSSYACLVPNTAVLLRACLAGLSRLEITLVNSAQAPEYATVRFGNESFPAVEQNATSDTKTFYVPASGQVTYTERGVYPDYCSRVDEVPALYASLISQSSTPPNPTPLPGVTEIAVSQDFLYLTGPAASGAQAPVVVVGADTEVRLASGQYQAYALGGQGPIVEGAFVADNLGAIACVLDAQQLGSLKATGQMPQSLFYSTGMTRIGEVYANLTQESSSSLYLVFYVPQTIQQNVVAVGQPGTIVWSTLLASTGQSCQVESACTMKVAPQTFWYERFLSYGKNITMNGKFTLNGSIQVYLLSEAQFQAFNQSFSETLYDTQPVVPASYIFSSSGTAGSFDQYLLPGTYYAVVLNESPGS
jgi:hypothetical protein